MRKSLVHVLMLTTLSVVLAFNGCESNFYSTPGKGDSSADNGSQGTNTNPDGTEENPPIITPALGTVSLTSNVATAVVMELADQKSVTITVTSVDSYAGLVTLKLATDEIDALDSVNEGGVLRLLDTVKTVITPSTVTLTAGGSAQATVNISTETMSPSLAEHFHVEAYRGSSALFMAEGKVDLTIMPLFRVKVKGLGDANWLIGNSGKSFLDFNRVVNFRVHGAPGLQVLFDNYDTVARTIHSNGAIAHQPGEMAASVNGVTKGGTYAAPAPIVGPNLSNAATYLHNTTENGAIARRLNFNLP